MDTKKLIEKLKDQGLELTEDAAKMLVGTVFTWAEEEIKNNDNAWDDIFLAVFPPVKKILLDKIDEIDGKKG